MTTQKVKNVEASIRARLLNFAKKTGENYNAVLLRFFQERFLARLGKSSYRDHFVLKGGLLLLSRHINPFRPTMDIDMLGVDISSHPEHLLPVVKEIAGLELKDGVRFDTSDIVVTVIKEDAENGGLRFNFAARLGTVKTRLQLDIGFGDAVPATFIESSLPVLLSDFSMPVLLLYPLESVIAEKFHAIVYLGFATSRMKDFYDILFLAHNNAFTLVKLKQALEATFARRQTDMAKRFFLYEPAYIIAKEKLWKSFIKKIGSDDVVAFSQVVEQLEGLLEPVLTGEESENDLLWDAKGRRWLKPSANKKEC